MNTIIIYGSKKCGKCEYLKHLLETNNRVFEYYDDEKILIEASKRLMVQELPICEFDGKLLSYLQVIKYAKGGVLDNAQFNNII